jgi:hypothetical protein
MRIAIIGAGMSGLSCAQGLVAGGHEVSLFDKGRGPGGRMATRRIATPLGEASFDHGAQYFTARDPHFAAQLADWAASDVVSKWPAAGPDAWVGTPAMNAPIRRLADQHDVTWSVRIVSFERQSEGWVLHGDKLDAGMFDGVVVAVPAEQAADLLRPHAAAMAELARETPTAPCWTVMAAFAAPLSGPDVLRDAGPIGWAARNSAKPARVGPESWVIQANPGWSIAHLEEEPEAVGHALLTELATKLGIPVPLPVEITAHRWRFARSGAAGGKVLWDPAVRLGACGDWLLGPRIECAWLSGQQLAHTIDATVPA